MQIEKNPTERPRLVCVVNRHREERRLELVANREQPVRNNRAGDQNAQRRAQVIPMPRRDSTARVPRQV